MQNVWDDPYQFQWKNVAPSPSPSTKHWEGAISIAKFPIESTDRHKITTSSAEHTRLALVGAENQNGFTIHNEQTSHSISCRTHLYLLCRSQFCSQAPPFGQIRWEFVPWSAIAKCRSSGRGEEGYNGTERIRFQAIKGNTQEVQDIFNSLPIASNVTIPVAAVYYVKHALWNMSQIRSKPVKSSEKYKLRRHKRGDSRI